MAANHLLFFGLLLSLFQTSTCVGTSIDVNPSKLELPDASAANGGTVNITCRAKPGAKSYYTLTIFRSLNSDNSKKKIVLFDIADKVVTGPFEGVSGSVSSSSDNMSLTLIMKKAKCGDSGRYFCELFFQAKDLSVLQKDSYEDLEVEVIPGEITLTATPSGLTQWVVNETLSMRCNGAVGTVLNNKTVIDWIWEYGKEINNQVASWTRYPDEEDISPGLTTSGDCFENRNSILLRSLQIEDTNRVYRCYVRRNGKSYPDLGAKQSVGTVSLERVTTPAGSGGGGGGGGGSPPDKSVVGPAVGGVVGGLVVLIVIIVIVVIVLRRRSRRDSPDDTHKPPESPAEVSYSQPNRFRNNREPQGVANKAMDEPPAGEKPSPHEPYHPPRYANDFHQGHRNQGYDYNPDPSAQGGRGSRYSSDDDGTDNRVNTSQHSVGYGDPSIGTAI